MAKNNKALSLKKKNSLSQEYAVIDLFCGIGGLTHGFVKEKFNVVAGIDIDETCKYAYEENNKAAFINKKIEEVTGEYLNSLYPKGSKKILIGCAPCQPFSKYTSKVEKDEKWGLLYHFARLIKEVKPDIVSMENVPHLVHHKVYKDFVKRLQKLDYNVSPKIVKCEEYGVPQKRRRLVLLASKNGNINLIKETHKRNYKTVKDAIGKLKPIKDGETCKSDKVHKARKLDEINKERIEHTPPGGGWKDWPKRLVLKCHKKKTGKTYRNVYGRMEWNKPAPTITTLCCGLGNGRYGHPKQDRAISLREAALFQSFPKYYKFIKPYEPAKFTLGRHIGNAVPVQLGKIIAKSIKNHLL
jgi:DNA (cytosine-5)-methyltransferase 1